MAQLIHGGDIYTERQKGRGQGLLDFSANINPLGLPDSVKQAVVDGLSDTVHYPDPLCRELISALAREEGVREEQLVCGNGAADLIFRLVVAKMPYKAVVPAPTFAEYEKSLESVGCVVKHHVLSEQRGFQLDESILFELNETVDMLFLCNPNNPTGQIIGRELLSAILSRCEEMGILLVLDECFCDFVESPADFTMKDWIEKSDNLFILKAFTKSFAMPGLRLGYGICGNETLLSVLGETGQPWSVSLPAQLAGVQALREKDYLQRARELVFEQRARLAKELSELGFTVYPPGANYIFFKLGAGYRAKTFRERMLEHGILVRSCGNYEGLGPDFFRIAVKTRDENDRLMAALRAVRENVGNGEK